MVKKRDFAKVQSQVKSRPASSGMSAAMAVVSLLVTAGVAFSVGYLAVDRSASPNTLTSENSELKMQLTEKNKQLIVLQQQVATLQATADKQSAKKPQQDATQRVGDLTFYSSLPKQKVVPSPLGDTGPAAKMNVAPHQPSHGTLHKKLPQPSLPSVAGDIGGNVEVNNGEATASMYRLQVGSYIRRSDAEGFLNRLAKAGLSAQVHKKMVDGIGVRYRVMMGPYRGLAAASAAKSLVREKLNIDGLLLRE
ncbi:MAG: SPOR domain-containing protein [Mariprofundaceae bacterium]|nr:SPOR domain-containing protein [Mariprofundaceae bacterium]